ncbi:DUF3301 domain-containing protein [Ectopseudomonas guguanensis]|uniref:DUF3301 domain-containing protein n=1 Tax=Ectopseudomonas guguanensis TaxID=1198456 RepID=UPI0012D5CFE3|nr:MULTISPECIES: DUF3301 domain-containing protein [Pseudomonas]MPT18568.1 DUF3301 domain-containing protein [Pseudomonas sp.]WJH59420.1 DUF3301 domain-containing protein [Pseudomonas guguanensis]
MINLFDVFLLMLFSAVCAWLWRGHGIRERALALAKQHCAKLDVELLDGAVALRRLAIQRDARGHRRLARLYDFEFTVTGEQRLRGHISMFGAHLGRIELEPHPILEPQPEPVAVQTRDNVIRLEDWRRKA